MQIQWNLENQRNDDSDENEDEDDDEKYWRKTNQQQWHSKWKLF